MFASIRFFVGLNIIDELSLEETMADVGYVLCFTRAHRYECSVTERARTFARNATWVRCGECLHRPGLGFAPEMERGLAEIWYYDSVMRSESKVGFRKPA